MVGTQLSRMLADQRVRPDALSAFALARRAFMEGRRLEMQELAAELGVSRATVFRWVGSRDELLVEVIWSLTEPTLRRAVSAAEGLRGSARLVSVMGAFAEATIDSPSFMGFVQREPERALRLLTTRASWYQSRLAGAVEQLLREETEAGAMTPPLPMHDLAYLMLRIVEAFVYADLIAGETPDPTKVRQAMGVLLRE
ncbi:putative TetR family transcriptional regulator [Nostocoides japonicum T1-X7]|uniref:Putative TetR family transcriptional regulator n=1 Tax=Nostocoides japonicum T1-X7 TaxID=1194083 RepID=A0A077M143_9MICO|nr:QsdR family transcriptional regulator [Tetrasphaera japonica]CCH79546.1 putative TetR family transcriptional regulator [Tetrasphaera japonica T1-X7]